MRFVDANVFIYAVLSPKTSIPEHIKKKKEAARQIFLRINNGEIVTTSTVHLSEVANVLEDVAGIGFAVDFLSAVFSKTTIVVEPVTAVMYHKSVFRAQNSTISINDALALIIMEQKEIDEIYTFDRHFDQVGVRVVQE